MSYFIQSFSNFKLTLISYLSTLLPLYFFHFWSLSPLHSPSLPPHKTPVQALTVNHFSSFFFSIKPYRLHVFSNQISSFFNHSLSLALTIFNHFFIHCFTHQFSFNHFQNFTLHLCLIYTHFCQFTFLFFEPCHPCTHHLFNFTNSQCKHHPLDFSFYFFLQIIHLSNLNPLKKISSIFNHRLALALPIKFITTA